MSKYKEKHKEQVETAFGAFLKWALDVELRPIASEQMGYHPKHRYAGTLDLVAYLKLPRWKKPKLYLIDVKAAKGHYNEHGYQAAAYAECLPYKVDGIGVLRLDKETGLPDFKCYTKQRRLFLKIFLACRKLYGLMRGE
jgi:hypothetical protein